MSEPSPNRRILVIDDNEAIHTDFRKILAAPAAAESSELRDAIFGTTSDAPAEARATYEIDSALQGQQGAEMVRKSITAGTPYALAFVDMRMPPGWDGLETIDHLWAIDPNLQVVICTAYSDYTWSDIADRFGTTDRLLLLKKPFDNAEVAQLACALTEKWNLGRQATFQLTELERLVDERTGELQKSNEELTDQIARREAAEEQLRHDATHDALTGLPNRALLLDRLRGCIERHRRDTTSRFALLFLDLDNFKMVNDSLGHEAGDDLLIQIANRLAACLRGIDSIVRDPTARLGGDEFVLLLDSIGSEADAQRVAERVHEAITQPFDLGGTPFATSASIGIAMCSDGEVTAEELLRDADTAMYRAKMSGKAQSAVFDRAMHYAVTERMQLENELRLAVREGGFEVYHQPIIHLETGAIVGSEALVRWNHPERGVVGPDQFIAIAEETGLIIELGRWVLTESCRQAKEWNDRLPAGREFTVNVNLSRRQLAEPDIVEVVQEVLRETGLPPTLLKLEITESMIMQDTSGATEKLERLDALDVELCMDDFGTGHSSLSCLHQLPIGNLKIDRSFAKTMATNRDYAAVIQAITTLAHNLGARVTAEGIEQPDQLAQLIALDCDLGQGYLFARPQPAAELWPLIEQGRPSFSVAG